MSNAMTKQEANEKIATLLQTAHAAVTEAEVISDAHGTGFNMGLGGYGMGGWYSDGEWQSSSNSC